MQARGTHLEQATRQRESPTRRATCTASDRACRDSSIESALTARDVGDVERAHSSRGLEPAEFVLEEGHIEQRVLRLALTVIDSPSQLVLSQITMSPKNALWGPVVEVIVPHRVPRRLIIHPRLSHHVPAPDQSAPAQPRTGTGSSRLRHPRPDRPPIRLGPLALAPAHHIIPPPHRVIKAQPEERESAAADEERAGGRAVQRGFVDWALGPSLALGGQGQGQERAHLVLVGLRVQVLELCERVGG